MLPIFFGQFFISLSLDRHFELSLFDVIEQCVDVVAFGLCRIELMGFSVAVVGAWRRFVALGVVALSFWGLRRFGGLFGIGFWRIFVFRRIFIALVGILLLFFVVFVLLFLRFFFVVVGGGGREHHKCEALGTWLHFELDEGVFHHRLL